MALAMAWQYLNAMREQDDHRQGLCQDFSVDRAQRYRLERLKGDFAGGRIFRNDPILPEELGIFWDFDCIMRGGGERAIRRRVCSSTNIQQFYDRPDRAQGEEPRM